MTDNTGDKKYLETLLNALSVDEAMQAFNIIDNEILQLLQSSSEDFLSLNDHFKTYHKESKHISQNASKLIEIITDDKTTSSFDKLKNFKDGFIKLTKVFSEHVEYLDVEIQKTTNKIENLKIGHSNYKQNLLSLKILLANLKIDNISDNNKSNEIEQKTENIKALILTSDTLVEQFVSIALESYLLLNKIKKENYDQVQKLNDNIEIGVELFQKKYNEASQLYPSFKELTEKNSVNLATIITNLQYHDIIRQKIEHIQRTHKDIIGDLESFKKMEDSQILLHSKAKTFLKIRDIAGLQAAQLLHANKQYQVAINEIGLNLENIGNDMISITNICSNLVRKSTHTKVYFINNILENLKTAHDYHNKLIDFVKNIKEHTQALSEKYSEFSKISTEIHSQKESIKSILNEIIIKYKENSGVESKTIQQLSSLISETDTLEKHIQEIHEELKVKVDQIVNPKENFLIESNILKSLNDITDTIPELIEKLKVNITHIDDLLEENTGISSNVSLHIKSSLRNIKFYELFEKACARIIEELNAVNLKLNYGTDVSSRSENLQHLKNRYTMASEHLIHDHISKLDISEISTSSTEQVIINIANQKSDEDDDNLELF